MTTHPPAGHTDSSQRHDSPAPVYTEHIPRDLEQGVLYISKPFKIAIHLCACGCGIQTVTPLRADGWTLTTDADGAMTLDPSIGNGQLPCHSHYYIRANGVVWLSPMPAESARAAMLREQRAHQREES